MKLLKTLIIALVCLLLVNCTAEQEDAVQIQTQTSFNLQQAKDAFEASYAEHLKFVAKRTNQLRRNETVSKLILQQEFEVQWSDQMEKLKEIAKYTTEEDARLFLANVFNKYKKQGIVATPCFDDYLKALNEANESFILCGSIAIVTGGEALPVCAIYYLNELRIALNDYTNCMENEYGA